MFPVDAWDSNLRLQCGDIPEFTQIARRSRQSCSGCSSGIPDGPRSTHTLPTSFFFWCSWTSGVLIYGFCFSWVHI